MSSKEVHGEIEYIKGDGMKIHSDVCPPDCNFNKINKGYREYLHTVLDEWIDNSNGSGGFYIKSEGYIFE